MTHQPSAQRQWLTIMLRRVCTVGCIAMPVPAAAQISVSAAARELVGLSISSVENPAVPTVHSDLAVLGDTLVVKGRDLSGAITVTLKEALTSGGKTGASPNDLVMRPVIPFARTSRGFRFVIPEIKLTNPYPSYTRYVLIVARGAAADTSNAAIQIGYVPPVRKITSVEQLAVLSRPNGVGRSARIKIHGIGFADKPDRYEAVSCGYFGNGTLGSATNPCIPTGNLSDTYVELWLPATCDQEGILMLGAPPRIEGGSDELIIGDKPIIVSCAKAVPSGMILNSNAFTGNMLPRKPGSTIQIRGTGLRYVTRVTDQQGTASFAFRYSGSVNADDLIVTIPSANPGGSYLIAFALEHKLDPMLAPVSGYALVMSAPTFTGISPAWAEAGQMVTVHGTDLTYGLPPKVTVGGTPAQVISSSDRKVEIRLGAGTANGPITIQNEMGITQLTGPFHIYGGNHPGFFVVSGPSVVQSVTAPRATLAKGDVLLIKGQNLARLGGICVLAATGSYVEIKRPEAGNSAIGEVKSNTEMQVTLDWLPTIATGSPIQVYAPNAPPGDFPPTSFACKPNTTSVIWPVAPASQNSPPVAMAGGPYTIKSTDVSVQLDGRGSVDPDANDFIALFQWDLNNDGVYDVTQAATCAGCGGVIAVPTTTLRTVGMNLPGVYPITLRTTDTKGSSGTASTTLTLLAPAAIEPSPPPIAPPTSAPLTLSLTTGAGITVGSVPTCTDGTRLFNVTGSAPNYSVAVTSPGTYTLTCTFDVTEPGSPPPSSPPPAASNPDPVSDTPVGSGSFRVHLPGGARSGKAAFCSMPAMDGMLAVYLEGGGITGGITGRKAKKGTGTFPVLPGGDGGFEIAVVSSVSPIAAYPGETGELKITSWTDAILTGTFSIQGKVNDAEGLQQDHSVTGSFSATPLGGC